ncbi:leucine-rich repeat-containing protein, putative [Entamoeba invadens IP1]|uniref:Leucine-rich repeat-containing protein, putative n=2 Tax=Entamoeba invadens TaxID=33085 RepID=A0A0A1U0K7_ENTIV|nr:leucine-rich repeat-containing protein, putative [Entamoeba invadens IP1]ELP87425.1 leucine-rich repeat-containing protein, putative [Entamoeba invadens IP1]BAN41596.1 leucine-rich repeat-containing protein, putative [Entamoeba invadens]|eukprot:XP_004254196.1 leucine-rich repeat-containing protein, putative [Entamoeba invadens IP1]
MGAGLEKTIQKQGEKGATEVNLSKKGIKKVPPCVNLIQKCKILNLSFNEIQEVPQEFGSLYELEDLNMNNNKLKEVPLCFTNLMKLKNIYLSFNQISKLPSNFFIFSNLRALNFTHNQLTSLPTGMVYCSQLVELRLNFNNLEYISNEIEKLVNLKTLTCTHNKLYVLPPGMSALKSIDTLDFSNNRLRTVPYTLSRCSTLRTLSLVMNEKLEPQILKSYEKKMVGPFLKDLGTKEFETLYIKDCLKQIEIFARSLNMEKGKAEIYFETMKKIEADALKRKEELKELQKQRDIEQAKKESLIVEQGELVKANDKKVEEGNTETEKKEEPPVEEKKDENQEEKSKAQVEVM